nr:MAG TPA: hypothetical protein [Caudoviricetes sp.]
MSKIQIFIFQSPIKIIIRVYHRSPYIIYYIRFSGNVKNFFKK